MLSRLEPTRPGSLPPIDQWPEPPVYDVFQPDGTWLARLQAPDRFVPMYMRGDHVWGVVRDSLDVSYVMRWRVTPPLSERS